MSDNGNSRVLIWNQIPTQNNQPADICLGQASCSTAAVGTSAGQFRNPYGLRFVSGRLYVADTNNHRVLWFDAPVAQGSLATRVLGQQNLTSGGANSGGPAASTLLVPRGVFADGNRVLVADGGNHRVLIWNSLPTRDGQPADVVVGQASFGNSYTRPDRVLVETRSMCWSIKATCMSLHHAVARPLLGSNPDQERHARRPRPGPARLRLGSAQPPRYARP